MSATILFLLLIAALLVTCADNLDDPIEDSDPLETLPVAATTRAESETNNQRPIIGILTSEYHEALQRPGDSKPEKPKKKTSYITASYVKFVEGGGARVVPIMSHLDEKYLRKMFKSVNGIIIPGALLSLETSEWAAAARILYELAIKENDDGIYFPLWAECLGLQWLLYFSAGSPKHFRQSCDYMNATTTVNFTSVATTAKSRMYGKAPKSILKIMTHKPVMAHSHRWCVSMETFNKFGLDQKYRVLTTNYDAKHKFEFVSSVEDIKYPFYGLGFLPEYILYEWWPFYVFSHSSEAVAVSQYFARWWVDECRKNGHKFKTMEEESRHLIYNYVPEYTGLYGSDDEQKYFFDPSEQNNYYESD